MAVAIMVISLADSSGEPIPYPYISWSPLLLKYSPLKN